MKLFVWNLILILVLGVAICGWALRYTEWFPIIGGALTLGGAFSWLAFVSKILPEEQLKALQDAVYHRIFNNARTLIVVILLLLTGALLAFGLGTIQIEPFQMAVDKAVWISPIGQPNGEALRLAPGGEVRELVWTGLFGRQDRIVKVSGLPDKRVTACFLKRIDLSVPASFCRPVVLLQPSQGLISVVRNNPMRLRVAVETNQFETDFEGTALWIGCDADVDPPPDLLEQWRTKMSQQYEHLVHPLSLTPPGLDLQIGQRIRVEFLKDNDWKSLTEFVVKPLSSSPGFHPQLEVLNEPR